jgi:hypothetical protein
VKALEFNIDGKKFTFTPSDYAILDQFDHGVGRKSDLLTRGLLTNLQTQCGCTVIGFFIAGNSEFYAHCYDAKNETRGHWTGDRKDAIKEGRSAWRKEENKNNCVEMTNKIGFNKYYILNTGTKHKHNLAIDDIDIEDMDDGMTHNEAKRSFLKLSKNKRSNKVLMGKLGKSIAMAI